MPKLNIIIFRLLLACFSFPILAQTDITPENPEKNWGIGVAVRTASIPFNTENQTVGSLIPLMFYEGKYLFLRGISGGVTIYDQDVWRLRGLGRLHFFDFPKEYQNKVQGTNIDWGAQLRYRLTDWSFAELELMSDLELNYSSNLRIGLDIRRGYLRFEPFAELKIKSEDYNSYYYGLTVEKVNSGMDISIGYIFDYNVWKNFYLFSAARLTYLDNQVRKVSFMNSDFSGEVFVGFGFANNRTIPRKTQLEATPYIRFAQGRATSTDLMDILAFKTKPDPYNNQLTSVFYGHPLTDELFGIPLHIYLTAGFAWHWKSDVQDHSQEVVLAMKFNYMFSWPIRWRIGFAEGFSYVNKIPFIEKQDLEKKGYNTNKLLNFLDYTIDLNLGDIFGGPTLQKYWFGFSIHHRSGIFEMAQHFGRVNGGSNYNTLYLQYHF